MKYLRDREFYDNLYDRGTVDECRQWEKICMKDNGKPMELDGKKLNRDERIEFLDGVYRFTLHFMTGERYVTKDETIRRWMDGDRQRDDLLENARTPIVRCRTCLSEMEAESRMLWGTDDDRVLFMFVCPNKCLPNRGVFENGEDMKHEPDLCPKCKAEMSHTTERENKKIVTTYRCSYCDHKIVDSYDTSEKKKEEVDPNFERDRTKFCLSMEEGLKFLDEKRNLEEVRKYFDQQEEKDNNKELYDRVAKLKKLTIPQLKEFIIDLLKAEVYTNLVFDKPVMGMVVSLNFSIEDPTNQKEYDSRQKLSKILKKGLEETNWRLMSNGISYRLGVLTGSLRIYEKEEDLVKLIGKTKDKNN